MTASSLYLFPLIAFCLALLVHYLIIDLSFRKGLFLDERDKIQKAHKGSTPRIGGLGIFLAALFMVREQTLGVYLILSTIPVFLAGFLEDYSGKVSPLKRLAIMALGPLMVILWVSQGIWMDWGFWKAGNAAGVILTILLLIGIANGINFIDGQNGLAGGSALISLLAMLWISRRQQDVEMNYLLLVMIAAILAFLIFNYPKGKIFLGDSGAYLSGFLLAALGILLVERHKGEVSPLLLPLLLIYPLWEVIFSTIRKILWDHISPFQSDKFHLHQLIYRNYGREKGYRPALILLPFQILLCVLGVLFFNDSLALSLFSLIFIAVYCLCYFYQHKRAIKK